MLKNDPRWANLFIRDALHHSRGAIPLKKPPLLEWPRLLAGDPSYHLPPPRERHTVLSLSAGEGRDGAEAAEREPLHIRVTTAVHCLRGCAARFLFSGRQRWMTHISSRGHRGDFQHQCSPCFRVYITPSHLVFRRAIALFAGSRDSVTKRRRASGFHLSRDPLIGTLSFPCALIACSWPIVVCQIRSFPSPSRVLTFVFLKRP